MRHHTGFTLIELVMVMVIVGVLSAFVLPKFVDFNSQARKAGIEAVAGACRSAVSITHARQLVEGGAPGDPVALNGASITMVDGYPTADEAGIVKAAQLSDDYDFIGGGAFSGVPLKIAYKGAPDCFVHYLSAFANTMPLIVSVC